MLRRILGKAEVDSSILSGGTIISASSSRQACFPSTPLELGKHGGSGNPVAGLTQS